MGYNMIESIKWQKTCCAWHGEYAEHPANDGGVLRIKRAPDINGYLVMHFGTDGKCHTIDNDGVPTYKLVSESELLALI